jgi:hypothetical protein
MEIGDCAKIHSLINSTELNGKYCMIATPFKKVRVPQTHNGDHITVNGFGIKILPEGDRTGFINEKNLTKVDCRSVAIHLTGMEQFKFEQQEEE